MEISNINTIMARNDVLFFYSGTISQNNVPFFIEEITERLTLKNVSSQMKKKINFILIEQVQNMIKYTYKTNNNQESIGKIIVDFDEESQKYFIYTCNEISPQQKIKLKQKIEILNKLSDSEKRKMVRQKLRNEEDKHLEGAGLGLIEMARYASEKLEYCFEETDDKVYYHIMTYI